MACLRSLAMKDKDGAFRQEGESQKLCYPLLER